MPIRKEGTRAFSSGKASCSVAARNPRQVAQLLSAKQYQSWQGASGPGSTLEGSRTRTVFPEDLGTPH